MAFTYKITVFTPTYNRAYIIENLYRSLQRQSFQDFEWLVVDDGSSDGTQELFEGWMREENPFPIRYHKKENGGKCRAINRALELAQGELFFTVDSDDYLTDDALEKIVRWEAELPKDRRYCGLAGNLGTAPDATPNKRFDGGFYEGSALDRYGAVNGERAMVFYTDVHRKYRYPEFLGEKFMTEAVTWNRMANDGYQMRFYNDIIWVYEYKEDGLTHAGEQLFWNNPQGYGLFLRDKAKILHHSGWQVFWMWYYYVSGTAANHTSAQIAQYIGMPRWLAAVMRRTRLTMQLLKGK